MGGERPALTRAPTVGARVGARVRYERDRRRLSRAWLAQRSGFSPTYLLNLERGVHKNPTPESIARLAVALGVPETDLLAGPPAGADAAVAGALDEAKARIAEVARHARATLPPDEAAAVLRALVAHVEALARGEDTGVP